MEKTIIFAMCLAAFFGCVVRAMEDEVEILYEPFEEKTYAMPEYCKSRKMEFCFNNTDYPTEIVEELLKDLPNLEVAKNDDVGEYSPYGNRQGSADEPDCLTQATDDPIYYIVDEAGRDRVVVQMEGRFQQRYSVMWCDKEGSITSKTKHFLEATVTGHNMSCENKYMQYEFLVLSLKPDILGKWHMERARTKSGIPVCCACRYQKKN